MKSPIQKISLALCLLLNSSSLKAEEACCEVNGCNYFIEADFLYWQARQENINAVSGSSFTLRNELGGGVVIETGTQRQNFKRLDYDWKPGFRIGAGFDFSQCGFQVATYWTHFNGHGSGHGKTGDATSSARWNLDYDVIDFILSGPEFCCTPCLTWQPFVGVRGAINYEKFHFRGQFIDVTVTPTVDSTFTNNRILRGHDRVDYKGIGPEIGINADWYIGKGFSIYGKMMGALLFSQSKGRLSQFTQVSSIDVAGGIVDFSDTATADSVDSFNSRFCQIVAEFGLGIEWCYPICVCNYQSDLNLRLGWEHSQWFDHDKAHSNGDMCFDGLTLAAQIKF